MKFIHLSPPSADFSSELQSQLRILNGNILYITREVDKIYKIVNKLELDSRLQKQIDEYYGGTGEAHLGTNPEDSKQEEEEV